MKKIEIGKITIVITAVLLGSNVPQAQAGILDKILGRAPANVAAQQRAAAARENRKKVEEALKTPRAPQNFKVTCNVFGSPDQDGNCEVTCRCGLHYPLQVPGDLAKIQLPAAGFDLSGGPEEGGRALPAAAFNCQYFAKVRTHAESLQSNPKLVEECKAISARDAENPVRSVGRR